MLLTIFFLILIFLGLLLYLFPVFFDRNPKRKIPKGRHFLAPADGKVIKVLEVGGTNQLKYTKGLGKLKTYVSDVLGKKEGYLVAIFMNPLDVHVNRIPFAGKVESVKHKDGKLISVTKFESFFLNEKNELLISSKIGKNSFKYKVIQVAGLVARKIVCNLKKGDEVKQGAVYGRIKLGSQAVLIIPKKIKGYEVKLNIGVNDRVKAGKTILAKIS